MMFQWPVLISLAASLHVRAECARYTRSEHVQSMLRLTVSAFVGDISRDGNTCTP